jgi:hypothetical protein
MQAHLEDFTGTLRSAHKDLCKIMQGPLRGFHQDLYKILAQGIAKDLDHGLDARTPKRTSQDPHKWTCWRGINQDRDESQKSFHTSA